MITSTFAKAIETTTARMKNAERQAVKAAIKAGSKVVSCGRYYANGPVVLAVAVPESWRNLEAYRSAPWVSCIVPEDKATETMEWAKRN